MWSVTFYGLFLTGLILMVVAIVGYSYRFKHY